MFHSSYPTLISDADQICYAVLCVFSYFAAGQEQKKAILEQAARVPPASHDALAPTSPVPDTDTRRRTSPQVEKRSPVKRTSEARSPVGRTEPSVSREAAERQQVRGPSAVSSPPPAERGGGGGRAERGADAGVQRTDSLPPPRRPPPPALPPASTAPPAAAAPLPASAPPISSAQPHQRLARAHSHAAPARPPDPPLIPPRVGTAGTRPIGPPPALPPRQLSAAADVGTAPR